MFKIGLKIRFRSSEKMDQWKKFLPYKDKDWILDYWNTHKKLDMRDDCL